MRSISLFACFFVLSGAALTAATAEMTVDLGFEIDGTVVSALHSSDVICGGSDAPAMATLTLPATALTSPILADWIAASRHDSKISHQITIVTLRGGRKISSRVKISGAAITSVTLPSIDDSKALPLLGLTLTGTGYVWETVTGGSTYTMPTVVKAGLHDISIGGIDNALLAFIKTAIPSTFPASGPGTIELTMSEGHVSAGAVAQAFADWLAGGNESREGKLNLEFAIGGSKTRAIALHGLTVKSFEEHAQDKVDAANPVTVTLNVADFDFGGTTAAAAGRRVFGTTYPAGESAELTVDSATYSVERFPVSESDAVVPAGNQKLVLVHARVKNGGARGFDLNGASVSCKWSDRAGIVSEGTGQLYDETKHNSLLRTLASGAEAKVILVAEVPATSVGKTLTLYQGDASFSLVYDLADEKNAVGKLKEPFVDPKDSTGAIALETIAAQKGTAYPLGNFDATFTGMVHVDRFIDGPAWIANFHVKNRRLTDAALSSATFSVHAAAGKADLEGSAIYPATGTDRIATTVRPGAETDIRVPFETELKIAPTPLSIQEGDSRRYVFAKP